MSFTPRTAMNNARPGPAGIVTADSSPQIKEAKKAKFEPVLNLPPLSPEGQQAIDLIDAGEQVIYVTGKAGTGKSTFIEHLRNRYTDSNKPIAFAAPTGIAALNIRGQTLHSLFKIPLHVTTKESKPKWVDAIQGLKILVIDEVAMVRADIIDYIFATLRYNKLRVQLVLIGDLYQLPPVVRDDEEQMIKDRYRSAFWFDSHSIGQTGFKRIEFKKVHRQSDPRFVEILDRIRKGKDYREQLGAVNRQCYLEQQHTPRNITLTPTRRAAESINSVHLSALDGKARTYLGEIDGKFSQGESNLPAPMELTLKVGAQVMVTKNCAGAVNGTLATVEEMDDEFIKCRTLDDNELITITQETWEQINYKYDRQTKKMGVDPVGEYTQFPLMLGWAVTIHKSQGLTLSSVAIDMGKGAFSAGQSYVALSRAVSLEGMSLLRPMSMRDVFVDERVTEFEAQYE